MRIVWTRRYLKELTEIGEYISQFNPSAAGRTVEAIHVKTRALLSANPFIGRRGEITGTRELVISGTPYIVAYRVSVDQIEVLFVQHSSREWPDKVQ